MRIAVLGIALATGCRGRVPLPEVPIEGGTPELQVRLRAELEAFDAAIGPGRVALREVQLVDEVLSDDLRVAGIFTGSRVVIDEDTRSPTMVLRHELCHAVDHVEGLADGPHPLWDEVAAGLFGSTLQGGLPHYPTEEDQRGEALAEFCSLGPMAAAALLDPCPGEAPLAAEIGAWLMDRVYRAYEVLPPVVLEGAERVTLDGWTDGGDRVAATTLEGVVAVGREEDWRAADLRTGRLLDVEVAPEPAPDEGPPARGVYPLGSVGLADGPAAVVGMVLLNHLRHSGYRTFVYDPDPGGWRVVDDQCEGHSVFLAGDELWRAWSEGPVMRWGRLLAD